ncbi:MAG: ArdC-like ssDNA-binding domain-containing protein [Planctomycetota bacterium]|jgi:hypothetical protein
MKRKATPEQKARAEERRANLRGLCNQIKAMSDGDRERMASKIQATTIEGRTLSAFNQCLIAHQRESCTILGGFRQWKNNGRTVKKGERGLGIWVPKFNKKEDSPEAPEKLDGFIFGTVFDVTQTDEIEATA